MRKKILTVTLAIMMCVTPAASVYADRESDLREDQAWNAQQMNNMYARMDELYSQKQQLAAEINSLDTDLVNVMVSIQTLNDVNTFFSHENSEAPDLYKYGGNGLEKEDAALLQYKLYQTKSSRRSLVLNVWSMAKRKAEKSEEAMAELVTLDIWKPDVWEHMLKIAQEKEYLSLIAYILEKLPKRKSKSNVSL